MQDSNALLSSLYRKGIKVWSENGDLRVCASKEEPSPEEIIELDTRKAEVIGLLEQMDVARAQIKPRAAGCLIPLTPNQRALWNAVTSSGAGLTTRFSSAAARVLGPLDIDLLKRSVDTIVQRHEALRTRIVAVDGVPIQQVDQNCEYEWDVIDMTEVPSDSVKDELDRRAHEFMRMKVEIAGGRLFAARVFRLSAREHVLILGLDHMITDGFSNEVLVKEIWTVYRMFHEGLPCSLVSLPLQYGDYAVWLHQTHGAWLQSHATFWKERLRDAPPTAIPVRHSTAETKDPIGKQINVTFGITLSSKLREIARREQRLLSMVVLTIYAVTMSRWCNQRDMMIRVSSNGRYWPELRNSVGWFSHQLFLNLKISKRDSFLDLLQRLSLDLPSAYAHPTFNWAELLDSDQLRLTTDVFFNWLPSRRRQVVTDHRTHQTNDTISILPFQLRLELPCKIQPFFYEGDSGIAADVFYRPDLFPLSTVERFASDLRLFAEEFARSPYCLVESVR